MIVLRDPLLVGSIPDPNIRFLVEQRFTEITDGEAYDADIHGYFVVVELGDSVSALEQEIGCPILAPCFEVLEEHPSFYEMVFIMGDGDGGTVLIIPKTQGINPDLLAMCQTYAVPAPDLAEA